MYVFVEVKCEDRGCKSGGIITDSLVVRFKMPLYTCLIHYGKCYRCILHMIHDYISIYLLVYESRVFVKNNCDQF